MNSARYVIFSSIPLFPPPQAQISSSPPLTPLAHVIPCERPFK